MPPIDVFSVEKPLNVVAMQRHNQLKLEITPKPEDERYLMIRKMDVDNVGTKLGKDFFQSSVAAWAVIEGGEKKIVTVSSQLVELRSQHQDAVDEHTIDFFGRLK
jgi:hypothetical protein